MSDRDTYQPDRVPDRDCGDVEDGDTRLPNWWLWTLWGTLGVAFVYWMVSHTSGRAETSVAKYESAGEFSAGTVDDLDTRGLTAEDLIRMSGDPEILRQGQEVYEQFCQVCHLAQGQGLVGPNLTDEYWIHGGRAADIHNTIVNGVVEKGMAAWGRQLGPERVDAVAAYLLTWRGKNIDGKEPQGERWIRVGEDEAAGAVESWERALPTASPGPT